MRSVHRLAKTELRAQCRAAMNELHAQTTARRVAVADDAPDAARIAASPPPRNRIVAAAQRAAWDTETAPGCEVAPQSVRFALNQVWSINFVAASPRHTRGCETLAGSGNVTQCTVQRVV